MYRLNGDFTLRCLHGRARKHGAYARDLVCVQGITKRLTSTEQIPPNRFEKTRHVGTTIFLSTYAELCSRFEWVLEIKSEPVVNCEDLVRSHQQCQQYRRSRISECREPAVVRTPVRAEKPLPPTVPQEGRGVSART